MTVTILEIIVGLVFIGLSLGLMLQPLVAKHLKTQRNRVLTIKPLGLYNTANNSYKLSYYFLDENNVLYSVNPLTWETDKKRGDILVCSDSSTNKQGDIVNSLRTDNGIKVTIPRKKLKFKNLTTPASHLVVSKRGERHFDILGNKQVNLWRA